MELATSDKTLLSFYSPVALHHSHPPLLLDESATRFQLFHSYPSVVDVEEKHVQLEIVKARQCCGDARLELFATEIQTANMPNENPSSIENPGHFGIT